MAIELTDDGTLDTVLRCTDCGEEFRGNYVNDSDPFADEPTGAEAEAAYTAWVDEFIAEVEAEHECPATPLPVGLHRDDNGTYPARTSLGCYPIHYYTADGGTLCADCANGKNGSDANHYTSDPQWRLVASDVYWEGPVVFCDHCNAEMKSAYGDPDAKPADDDIATADYRTFYQYGKPILEQQTHLDGQWSAWINRAWTSIGPFDTCEAALRAYMDRVQYWPNVWFISDHGNAYRIDVPDIV